MEDITSFDYSVAQTCQSLALTMFFMAFASLLAGWVPLAWGQARNKWIATMTCMAVGFSISGALLKWLFSTQTVPTQELTPFNPIGILIAMFCLTPLVVSHGAKALEKFMRRRGETRVMQDDKANLPHPVDVAREHAPDMLAAVEKAMSRIDHLMMLNPEAQHVDDATAMIMIERRIPSVMSLYNSASNAGTSGDRGEIARMALSTIVDIGEMAESARRRIAADRREQLDTESRYVSMRRASPQGLSLD